MKMSLILLTLFVISGCVGEQYCIKKDTNLKLSLTEAKEIAKTSDCTQGNFIGEPSCNEITGTWWIDLDLKKEGCAPACVINAENKKAEINWRCTGLKE